ncbi:MAG: LemA family protein, partial [Caulobacteraceae bacterium]
MRPKSHPGGARAHGLDSLREARRAVGGRIAKSGSDMNWKIGRALGALALIVLPLALASCSVNAIPTKQEIVKEKWADVQADYQRRADLIPNLVATVK